MCNFHDNLPLIHIQATATCTMHCPQLLSNLLVLAISQIKSAATFFLSEVQGNLSIDFYCNRGERFGY